MTRYLLIIGLLSGCGWKATVAPRKAVLPGSPAPGNTNDSNPVEEEQSEDQQAATLASFESTVYPILDSHCSRCHASTYTPFIAHSDPAEALQALETSQKVDKANPQNSRIYLRLAADNHNCWDECSADAESMLAAIQQWSNSEKEEKTPSLQTLALAIVDSPMATETSSSQIILEAEDGSVVNPMEIINNAAASGGSFVATANDNGPILAAGDNTAGTLNFTFEVDDPGNYQVFARVIAPTNGDNSFHVQMDDQPSAIWALPLSDALVWDIVNQDNGGDDITFNLDAGTHTLEFREREDGATIDSVVVTQDPSFDGNFETAEFHLLEFDLAEFGMDGARIQVKIAQFDEYSYIVKDLELFTDTDTILVEGIFVDINGQRDAQAATYARVSETVSPPGQVLSASALILPIGAGLEGDDVALSFNKLEVTP